MSPVMLLFNNSTLSLVKTKPCCYKYRHVCLDYHTYYFLVCRDGDVGFFASNIPKILWKGNWVRICGDGFWNDNNGSRIFCKKLGHEDGMVSLSPEQSISSMQSLYVGACAVGDTDLSSCKGGSNQYTVGEYSKCTTKYTYEIVCRGGNAPKTVSCKGKGIS